MRTHNTLLRLAVAVLSTVLFCSCGPALREDGKSSAAKATSTNAPKSARFGDFQVPIMAPDGHKSAMLRGESLTPVKPGLFTLTKPGFETFRTNGTTEMIVRGPQCFYDSRSDEVYSAGPISMNTIDQKFTIDGEGFTWKRATSQLVISNRTHALIRRTLLEATNTTASAKDENIDITSDQFRYDSDTARFTHSVIVKDASGQLNCGDLKVYFSADPTNKTSDHKVQKIEAEEQVIIDSKGTHVEAGKAYYDMVNQTIQLSDRPVWKMEESNGTSDSLVINRQNNALHAIGNVDLKVLTRSLIGTNSTALGSLTNATNMSILNIKAEDFTRTTNLTVFEGNVRATQDNASLKCERLTMTIPGPTREISEVLAERAVLMRRGDTLAAADSAVFDVPDDTITLRSRAGDPPMNWNVGEMKGRSSLLILHPNSDEMEASGSLQIEMPERKMSILPGTNKTITITADLLKSTKTRGVFTDHVEVRNADSLMRSGLLTINSGASNQVETIYAERGVSLQRGDRIATGQQAIYTAARSLIELTGSPKITDPKAKVSASAFLLNTTNNSFRTKGEYKIEVGDLTALKGSK